MPKDKKPRIPTCWQAHTLSNLMDTKNWQLIIGRWPDIAGCGKYRGQERIYWKCWMVCPGYPGDNINSPGGWWDTIDCGSPKTKRYWMSHMERHGWIIKTANSWEITEAGREAKNSTTNTGRRSMAEVKTFREGAADEPKFPADFEVAKKAVLQMTDITNNNNKYYAIELHTAKGSYRVYTHYGRTDDLETNPNAGARESRYFSDVGFAEATYQKIYREKTKKGYKELSLASAKIGSRKSIGKSSGEIDVKTLKKLDEQNKGDSKKKVAPTIMISPQVQELVSYLYSEATNALTTTVNAQITANGIETPLGVLTIGQIDKGQAILDSLVASFGKKKKDQAELTTLSGEFYTVIPHKFGRTRDAALSAVLDSADKLNEKQDTLQLMRDMLNVNGKTNVLVNPQIEQKYLALGCKIELVSPGTFKEIKEYVEKSAVSKYTKYNVKNIWKVQRPDEHKAYATDIGNHKLLFHGSAAKNWVGILSRGLLLPKIVVSLGVRRTDAGWLGNGIYFGDAICTSYNYAGAGKKNTRFISIANVALGTIKQYRKITYGLDSPPAGFHSCHGVRGSEFSDNEFVVYKQNQQRLEYLIEI